MAHNLNFNQAAGRHAFFNSNQAAWHKLGVVVDGAKNWQEAMNLALLNWRVDKVQLTSPFDGAPIDAWGIFRNDTKEFLGSVGNIYTPIQNEFAFEFVDTLLEADEKAHYVSAGALGKGEKIWCLAQLNGGFDVGRSTALHRTHPSPVNGPT